MKGNFFIEAVIKTNQPFDFKKPVLGFNSFSCHVWEQQIFEFPFITGNGQTFEDVVKVAIDCLRQQYGHKNIEFKNLYNERFNGEKISMCGV